MTKRAPGQFARKASDFYPTPAAAVDPLIPHLHRTRVKTFAEPCCGEGHLATHLELEGFLCVIRDDLLHENKVDARNWVREDYHGVDAVITNPPWERFTMAAIMEHQSTWVPAWFLIYSDWLFTKQSALLMNERCTDIVPIGRVKWFPDSASVGYDNCCWVRMTTTGQGAVTFWPFPVK